MRMIRITAAMVLAMACSAAWAEVKFASAFTDHMVLQRDKTVRIWGTAEKGKSVAVKISDQNITAKVDDNGKWVADLNAMKASETPAELTVSEDGGNTEKISDVLVGDVWICSGQSNMEFALARVSNADEVIPAATDDKIRLLLVPKKVSDAPLDQQGGKWELCSPETAKNFTAVGYFFGKEIHEQQHVPVGLIGTYWGGTLCEAWTPKEKLADAEWQILWEKEHKQAVDYPAAKEKWNADVKAWQEKVKTNPKLAKPPTPHGPESEHRPAVLWNGMIAPLLPMTIEGVIWYQGESNAGRAEQYRSMFPNMIDGWRAAFEQKDLPFFFVQLANYGSKQDSPAGSPWAELREAQAMTLKLPQTGMAVTIDIGNPANIHPTDKQTVGKRLALAAENVAYGRSDVIYQGPTYQSMATDNATAKITFAHADGLKAKGDSVKGFTLSGDDKKFISAEAKIDGNSILVSAPGIDKPTAVRYGWADKPEANLYNNAGLPAVPFRTDDWPMVTAGKK